MKSKIDSNVVLLQAGGATSVGINFACDDSGDSLLVSNNYVEISAMSPVSYLILHNFTFFCLWNFV